MNKIGDLIFYTIPPIFKLEINKNDFVNNKVHKDINELTFKDDVIISKKVIKGRTVFESLMDMQEISVTIRENKSSHKIGYYDTKLSNQDDFDIYVIHNNKKHLILSIDDIELFKDIINKFNTDDIDYYVLIPSKYILINEAI
jgi:hypothetical protein